MREWLPLEMDSGVLMSPGSEVCRSRYVLLSIKPEFVGRILEGRKYYEFRKKFPLYAERFVFYATSPVQRIVAIAERSHLLLGDLEYLWEETSATAGISREEFEQYYRGKTHGVALGLSGIRGMRNDMSLQEIGIERAPQSFQYLSEEEWRRVEWNVCRVEWD